MEFKLISIASIIAFYGRYFVKRCCRVRKKQLVISGVNRIVCTVSCGRVLQETRIYGAE